MVNALLTSMDHQLGARAMLGLLGLFGALFAGVVAEGVLSSNTKSDDDDNTEDTGEGTAAQADSSTESGTVDLLVIATSPDAPPDGTTETSSTDAEAPVPENLNVSGGDDDDILAGRAGADTIFGSDGDDLLAGRDGDDLIGGGKGADYIDGGAGHDVLQGDEGNDVTQGNDGNDLMSGGEGDDSLAGHMGADALHGDEGHDTLMGGSDADVLFGDDGADWLSGGFDDDVLHGGAGSDTLDGNDGNDTLWGFDPIEPDDAADVDFLNGGTGDDALMIGAGDHAHGGEGADVFTIADWIGEGEFAHISDYDPTEDDIVVLYDANAHPDPRLELFTADGSTDTTISLDGMPLAVVANGSGLTVEAVTLLPSNSF